MSDYAYLDKEKHTKVFAKNCKANDINKVFYCPDPNCTGIVYLCAYNSNKVNNYFKGNNHSKNCSFYKKSESYSLNDYNVKDFSPLNLLEQIQNFVSEKKDNTPVKKNITNNVSLKKSNKYIHSIKSLYFLAINNPIDGKINGYTISELVCFNKTSHIYTKYITGIKLIVCKYYYYDNTNKCIYFNYHSKYNTIKLKVFFSDEKLYINVKNKFYGFKGDILIFSNWSDDNKYICTTITSLKQITAIRD